MIVYLARDIPAFVMYYVNGESGSSLFIESTDSMIPCHVSSFGLQDYLRPKVTHQLHGRKPASMRSICAGC